MLSSMNNKISAVIITLNEERNIERCLNSIQSFVDEVIIYDSGSVDKTEEISNKFKVRFISSNWEGYSKTKNAANSLAEHSYILSIDADEEVDEVLGREIHRIKNTGLTGVYQINRRTNYCGKWIRYSGWYPDKKIRVFPKDIVWNDSEVHEELVLPSNLEVKPIKGHLNHYSYYSLKDHRIKADKYSLLTAEKYFKQKKKSYFLQPELSALARFFSMYIIKLGFLDGKSGWHIARISAASNFLKYKELRRLNATTKN